MNILAIYGPVGDVRVDEQLVALSKVTDEARERDVGYMEVRRMPQEAHWRALAGVGPDEFAVVMVRDGEAVGQWSDVSDPAQFWAAFDAAPDPGR